MFKGPFAEEPPIIPGLAVHLRVWNISCQSLASCMLSILRTYVVCKAPFRRALHASRIFRWPWPVNKVQMRIRHLPLRRIPNTVAHILDQLIGELARCSHATAEVGNTNLLKNSSTSTKTISWSLPEANWSTNQCVPFPTRVQGYKGTRVQVYMYMLEE